MVNPNGTQPHGYKPFVRTLLKKAYRTQITTKFWGKYVYT